MGPVQVNFEGHREFCDPCGSSSKAVVDFVNHAGQSRKPSRVLRPARVIVIARALKSIPCRKHSDRVGWPTWR